MVTENYMKVVRCLFKFNMVYVWCDVWCDAPVHPDVLRNEFDIVSDKDLFSTHG